MTQITQLEVNGTAAQGIMLCAPGGEGHPNMIIVQFMTEVNVAEIVVSGIWLIVAISQNASAVAVRQIQTGFLPRLSQHGCFCAFSRVNSTSGNFPGAGSPFLIHRPARKKIFMILVFNQRECVEHVLIRFKFFQLPVDLLSGEAAVDIVDID